jgi:hypothetical protein
MGLANADHTTLLLNTYTKLKDLSRLDSFIKLESTTRPSAALVSTPGSHLDAQAELPFDLETAIRVCRQAGYFEHASYLAKKHERHEDYLRIQIEDAGNYKEALQYLRVLGSEVVGFYRISVLRVSLTIDDDGRRKVIWHDTVVHCLTIYPLRRLSF